MKYKSRRKIFGLAMLAAACAVSADGLAAPAACAVYAAQTETVSGVIDMKEGGASIVFMPAGNANLTGRTIRLYRILEAQKSADGQSIHYTWNPEYAAVLQKVTGSRLQKDPASVSQYDVVDYISSLAKAPQGTLESNDSRLRCFVEEVRDGLEAEQARGTDIVIRDTRADGSVLIEGLPCGYYLADDITDVKSQHNAASLCMVSTAADRAQITLKADYPEVSKQILEDDGDTGWNDIADFEIGQTVPYRFGSTVPNMNGYETYFFAFHDRMDDCLDFDPASVSIVISSLDKEITLPDSQYEIRLDETELSFSIVIEDLKKIVDEVFDTEKDVKPYGQNIEVRFDAVLNERAANLTGRPGFENSVMLEFSNNPDSGGKGETGMTPWDTVVCFTYRLDGLKINDAGQSLEGASFRLYRDEACTDEILLKKGSNGYIVMHSDSLQEEDLKNAVEMTSDKDGNFVVYGLDQGIYYLKETGAPDGYRPLQDPVRLEIVPEFTEDRHSYLEGQSASDAVLKSLTGTASVPWFVSGSTGKDLLDLNASVENGSLTLPVVNRKGSVLPAAGSSMSLISLSAAAVMMSAGAYWLYRQKKEGKKQ